MMTCKDCLHIEVCAYIKPDLPICSDFADRSRYVVREKGEWESIECKPHLIYACSLCGDQWSYGAMLHFNFCPNCGADMRKGENG